MNAASLFTINHFLCDSMIDKTDNNKKLLQVENEDLESNLHTNNSKRLL